MTSSAEAMAQGCWICASSTGPYPSGGSMRPARLATMQRVKLPGSCGRGFRSAAATPRASEIVHRLRGAAQASLEKRSTGSTGSTGSNSNSEALRQQPLGEVLGDGKGDDLISKVLEAVKSRKLLAKAMGVLGSLAVVLGTLGFGGDAMANETITFMLPASTKPEVSRVQRTLVETWSIVREMFFDPTYNHQDWEENLRVAVEGSIHAHNAEEAYGTVREMLASLDDPFTRIVTPKEYEAFRISSDGALEGVGLVLASDPDSGNLVVIAPVEGGPADRAGIQSGDILLEIDHRQLAGMEPQDAAKLLRGKAGSSVSLKLMHTRLQPLTLSASAKDVPLASPLIEEVELHRESIALSPVYATLLPHSSRDGSQVATGYIRLAAFSQNAAEDMQRAVQRLEKQGATSFILDLRNNPGGLVKAGLDVAQMWLEGTSTLVNTVDRYGGIQTISAQDNGVHAITNLPLAVLVNHGSASASEILAGALQDNGRATLIGETTYGKGRIQSVFELTDGTALFVTVAKYLSPSLHEIDRVGVNPDIACAIPGFAKGSADKASQPGSQPGLREASLIQRSPASLMPLSRRSNGSTSSESDSAAAPAPALSPVLQQLPAAAADEALSPGDHPFRSLEDEIQGDSCVVTAELQLDALSTKL